MERIQFTAQIFLKDLTVENCHVLKSKLTEEKEKKLKLTVLKVCTLLSFPIKLYTVISDTTIVFFPLSHSNGEHNFLLHLRFSFVS
jgi:hypothetical protein